MRSPWILDLNVKKSIKKIEEDKSIGEKKYLGLKRPEKKRPRIKNIKGINPEVGKHSEGEHLV